MIRFLYGLFVGLAALALVRFFAGLVHLLKSAPDRSRSVEERSNRLVRCSRCGTAVPEGRAILVDRAAEWDGFVCSESCRDKTPRSA